MVLDWASLLILMLSLIHTASIALKHEKINEAHLAHSSETLERLKAEKEEDFAITGSMYSQEDDVDF
jgi:hypothetical protein